VTAPLFRFAPSPNGLLHLGHAYSALLNADLAVKACGRFLLRIEDIDRARSRPAFEAAIGRDLAWLGLTWEVPVRRQSEYFADYVKAADMLRERGLLYPCFCSRRTIAASVAHLESTTGRPWPPDPDGSPLYPGTCRGLSRTDAAARIAAGESHAWRLDMARALAEAPGPHRYRRFETLGEEAVGAEPRRWGDPVLVRADVPASYHLAVVHDDAVQGVTHVVRGADLEAATDLHVLLQALLRLPTPLYRHHALVKNPFGDKLSKSRGSESLDALRRRGVGPEDVRARLGFQPATPRI
jgi:glutamyl-Q tRNA(Asp) synthetase